MLIVFFVVILISLIIIMPFKSRVMGHFNLIEKKGFYSFKVWRIKVLCGKIYTGSDGKIKIEYTQNAIKDRYKDEFSRKLFLKIMSEIDVKKVEIYVTSGFKNNSFSSAMISSIFNISVKMIYSYLSQKYDLVDLYNDIEPSFSQNKFELTFDFVCDISILGIIKSLIKAKIEFNKESVYE